MYFEDFVAVLRRLWLVVLFGFLVGLMGAWFFAQSAPAVYRSTASTVVSANAAATDPSALNSVTASIAMTMPGYVSQATSLETVEAAAAAAGLEPSTVARTIKVSREMDSTVINWTFDSPDGVTSMKGLAAATRTFAQTVERRSGVGSNNEPSIQVITSQPAAAGALLGTRPLIYGLLAGLPTALAVYLLGLMWHLRRHAGEASARRVEEELRIPVIAIVEDGKHRAAGWESVARFLERRVGGDQVALVGVNEAPTDAAADLELALSSAGLSEARVVPIAAWEQDTPRLLGITDGMVLVLDAAAERRVGRVAAEFRSLTLASAGPACVLLDRRPTTPRS